LHPARLANNQLNSNSEAYDGTQMSKMHQIAKTAFFDIPQRNCLKYVFSLLIFISYSINKRYFAFAKHGSVDISIVFFCAPTKK